MTSLTIIIQSPPYLADNNKAWNALRLAGAAMASDMNVRIHLLDGGVTLARRGHCVPDGATDLEALLEELIECGLEVNACGMALDGCQIRESDLIDGVRRGSMKSLADWVQTGEKVLSF